MQSEATVFEASDYRRGNKSEIKFEEKDYQNLFTEIVDLRAFVEPPPPPAQKKQVKFLEEEIKVEKARPEVESSAYIRETVADDKKIIEQKVVGRF